MNHLSGALKLKKKYLGTCWLLFELKWYWSSRLQSRDFLEELLKKIILQVVFSFNLYADFYQCVEYSLKSRTEILLYYKKLPWFTLILANEVNKITPQGLCYFGNCLLCVNTDGRIYFKGTLFCKENRFFSL